MLSLDDNRWRDLAHRGWSDGGRYNFDAGAPYVPDELRALLGDPQDFPRFSKLWPYLSSEGTTWGAAYAAAPSIVEIAKKLRPQERLEHLIAIGVFVINSCPEAGDGFEIKPYLAEAYAGALRDAIPLLAETLLEEHNATDTRYLLAAAAALKGHAKLGGLIESMDCHTQCPNCETEIYELDE